MSDVCSTRMKVLHLPTPTGGMPWALAQGERALGLQSFVLYSHADWLGYRSDINLGLENADVFRKSLKLVEAFLSIRKDYDVFHFNWGSSLMKTGKLGMPHLDLPFYPRRAKLFVTYNGCDARQKYPTLSRKAMSACHNPECFGGMCNSGRLDGIRRRNIKKMSKYVQHMWAVNPDLLNFLPPEKSSFLPYAILMAGDRGLKPDFRKGTLKIVHAPTNRAAKGSEVILRSLQEVKREYGKEIEVLVIENVPHREALKRYREADIFIDQILIGWYGAFAVEAMSMGKPVICRIAEEDLHFLPKRMAKEVRDVILNADQNNLTEVLFQCIENRKVLEDRGKAGMDYARAWHDPEAVARITKEAYERSLDQ